MLAHRLLRWAVLALTILTCAAQVHRAACRAFVPPPTHPCLSVRRVCRARIPRAGLGVAVACRIGLCVAHNGVRVSAEESAHSLTAARPPDARCCAARCRVARRVHVSRSPRRRGAVSRHHTTWPRSPPAATGVGGGRPALHRPPITIPNAARAAQLPFCTCAATDGYAHVLAGSCALPPGRSSLTLATCSGKKRRAAAGEVAAAAAARREAPPRQSVSAACPGSVRASPM